MTQPHFPTLSNGLRVFSASLLSALLIMMPFVQMAAASRRSEPAAVAAGPDIAAGESGGPPATAGGSDFAPVPKPAPEPPALVGPVIVATKDDGLAAATTVAPGGTITYTVNIKNNGTTSPTDDATGVNFSDTIDSHTTLVPGSRVAAVSDKYNTIGNTQITVPDGATDLLGNDFDPDTGNNTGMTATAETKSSTQCAACNNVTINADGSFTYQPPVGFTGTDTFTYTANSSGSTATETVTITVTGMIWYINNNSPSCTTLASQCGTLSKPFSSLAAFQALNDGTGSNPEAGDNIFLFESATDYVGPVTLLNNQKFIGQDATDGLGTITGLATPSGTDPFPVMNSGNGTIVNITSASNDVNLGQGNTLRGFTAGNATGTAINGSTFGTLTVGGSAPGDVTINSTGRALALTTGTANGNFKAISSSGGANGILLTSCAGTLAIAGGTLTGASGDEFLIDGNLPTINVTYSGNITYAGASSAIRVTASTGIHTGNLTFDTGALSVTGGTGINVITSSGTYNFYTTTGSANINGAANGIILGVNSNGAYNFGQDGTPASFVINNTTGTSFIVSNTAADVTYNGNITQTANNATLVSMTSLNASGFVTFDNNGTLSATNGNGIQLTDTDGPVSFNGTTTLNGGDAGVDILNGSGATITFSSNATITSPNAGPAFNVSGSPANNGNYTYSGNITQNNAQRVVNIDGMTGAATFNTGAITGGASSTGININNTNGNVSFNNGLTLGTSGARMTNQAVTMTNGAGTGAGTYSLGAVSIFTNGAAGIVATGIDGTINSTSGTVDSTGATAINIDGPAGITTLGMTLTTVNSTGGTNNVALVDVGGTATLGSGALSGASGASFLVGAGSANITYNGTIANNTARVVDVQGKTAGGTVAFGGAISSTGGTGIFLNNNSSAVINFTGTLSLSTGTTTAFTATGGGTVTATSAANALTTTTATALNVANTDIGSGGLVFTSINVNGASKGIILNTTGTAGGNGSLSVTGTGTTVGSGGTIQNISARGAEFISTKAPSLKNMNFTNANTADAGGAGTCDDTNTTNCNAAIYLNTVTAPFFDNIDITGTTAENGINGRVITGGFTFTNGTIANAGLNGGGADLPADEGAMVMRELTGTVTLDNNNFSFSGGVTVEIKNTSGSLLLNTNSTTYRDTQSSANGQGGLQVIATGTTVVHPSVIVNINSCTFLRLRTHGVNVQAIGTTDAGSASADVDITTSTFDPDTGTMIGMDLDADDASTLVFNVVNNTKVYSKNGPAINVFGDVSASINGRINNNGDVKVLSNAPGSNVGSAIRANINKNATAKIEVKSNVVNVASDDAGIDLSGIGKTAANPGGATDTLDATVTGNNVTIGATSTYGVIILSATNAGDTNAICTNVATNAITRDPSSIASFRARVPSVNGFFRMNGFVTDAGVTWNNNGNTPMNDSSFGGSGTFAACTADLPTNPALSPAAMYKPEKEQQIYFARLDTPSGRPSTDNLWPFVNTRNDIASIFERVDINQVAQSVPLPTATSDAQLSLISRTANQLANFANAVSSLIEPVAHAEEIAVNKHGLDHQPLVRSHHANTERKAIRDQRSEDRDQRSEVRSHHAKASRALTAPMSGETVTASIGTLPAGGSVTITFQVTVDNPPNLTLLGPPRVENQGTVSGGNFSNVFTDDPNVGGAADKTATLIDLFNTTTTLASNLNPSNSGDSVTFTATINETPAQTPDPTGTVDFIDTNNGNAVICNDVTVTAGSAQCITAALAAGTHDMQAVYSGDGNFDGSNSNIVSQVVVACVTNPVVTKIADTDDGVCDADCSLREAIGQVCSGTTITFNTAGVFATPQTITLSLGELSVARNMTIDAPDAAGNHVTVSGGGASRVFNINPGKTVTLRELTITNGSSVGGGGIYFSDQGTLTLINVTVSGNTSTGGGGGVALDGGASGSATLTVINSTISGNTSVGSGGGIYAASTGGAATLTIVNSTVSGNNSNLHGGGLFLTSVTTTMTNVTVTDNRADNDNNATGSGGGLSIVAGALTTLHNTIVAGNFNDASPSTTRDDVNGALDAASTNNLIGDGTGMTGITHGTNGNQVGTGVTPINALLGALADNGGLTLTHALSPTSPAVETGSNTAATNAGLTTDQRGTGFPRIADSSDGNTTQTVDIGAFELHPSIEDIANQTTDEDTPKNVLFNLGDDTGSLISTVTATSSNTTLVPNAPANLSFTGSGGSRTLQITPAANQSGTTTITVTVTATNGRTAVDTFDLTVNAVNDPPSGTDNTVSTAEDTAYTFTAADFGFTDPNDSPANTLLAVKITTLPGLGTLTNNNVAVNAGDFIPVADINGGLLKFTPAADGTGSPYTSFTFQVQDNGGGTDLDPTPNTMSINVTGTNDDPTIANNTGITVTEGSTGNIITSAMLSVTDVDNTPSQLTYTIGTAPANGTLRKSGGALAGGGTFTQADINSNLITYDHDGSDTTSDSFTFTVSDGAGGSIGLTTFNITITPVNDAPVVTTTGANLSYIENDPATAVDSGVTITDGDSANLSGATVSITANFQSGQDVLGWIDNNVGDNITLSGASTAQTIILTGTDTVANYQAAVRAVTYQNTSENPSTATRTVTFTADDGTNTGSNTRNIDVTAVNDPPVNTVPGPQATNQNTPLTFSSGNSNQISVADVDAGTNPIKVTLTVTNGTLTLNGTSNLDFNGGTCSGAAGDGTADATMTFCGALTDVNNALNGLTYNPTVGYSGAATLTITSNDLGNSGTGGAQTDTDVVNIQVSTNVSVQDATVAEPASGTTNMVFTVSLSAPAPASGASVNFTTADEPAGPGKAVAGSCGGGGDYTTTSGTINFAAGEQVKSISVPVCADAITEGSETFLVNLSSPVNATIADGTATGTITEGNTAGAILISEIRTSGPGGGTNEFVEIYNNSNSPHTVDSADNTGYGIFVKGADCDATPVLVGTIPEGFVLQPRQHYLFVGATYSLANYGGTGAAAGDATLTSDIPSDGNVAIFKTANVAAISSVLRLDAVGFGLNTGSNCDLLREGSNLPAVSGSVTEHSFFRKLCAFDGGCTTPGIPKDTNNNATDFLFADTQGSNIPGVPRLLGAPGPENLASPLKRDATIAVNLLDTTKPGSAVPNRQRDLTSNPGNSSTFGTLAVRRRIVNGTGGNVTRLRFRIVEMTTFEPTHPSIADLRALTTTSVVVSGVNDPATCFASTGSASTPCTVTVQGTTLEQPPTQTIGGGLNATLAAGTVTLGTPLANGASVNVDFLLGVQQTGAFRFLIIVEALP